MNKSIKYLFVILLFWSIYHLFRDVSTDIFGFHNAFIDFAHRNYPGVYWCTPYCQYTTFPLEIFNIIAGTIVLKRNKIGILGKIILLSIPIWLIGYLQGEGPYI